MAPTVYFVDGDQAFLQQLQESLQPLSEGWDLHFVTEARSQLLETEDLRAGVVVTDWSTPAIDGIELCRELREREDGSRRFYVIVFAGVHSPERTADALDRGADDWIAKPCDPRELVARIRVGMRVLETEAELRSANRKLVELARTDPLTGLLNRRGGLERLEAELQRTSRSNNESLAVLLLDLDHFKSVNDRYGHDAGDLVLEAVGAKLRDACRRYDIAIRWGGEEFALVCPVRDEDEPISLAKRVLAAVRGIVIATPDGDTLSITASCGLTWHTGPGPIDSDVLLRVADAALYDAKAAGRDCIRSRPSADGTSDGFRVVGGSA